MNIEEEIVLIDRLRMGDRQAYSALYEQYHSRLYSFIIRFVKIPEAAEDILQEIFLKLWSVKERLDNSASLQAYLYKIARNCVFKALKKQSKERETIAKIQYIVDKNTESNFDDLRWKQYETILVNAIGKLPVQRQKVFKLCREEGKTYDGVALELGISKNTVKEHMVLATKAIKHYMNQYIDFQPILIFLLLFFS